MRSSENEFFQSPGPLGNFLSYFLGNMKQYLPPKIYRAFHTGGGGCKNSKFHHLDLLGPPSLNKTITATPKTPSEANSLDSGSTSFVWFFYSVAQAPRRSTQNMLRLQGCDSESLRFLWPNAIFVIATLRFYCDFFGKACDFEVVIANC